MQVYRYSIASMSQIYRLKLNCTFLDLLIEAFWCLHWIIPGETWLSQWLTRSTLWGSQSRCPASSRGPVDNPSSTEMTARAMVFWRMLRVSWLTRVAWCMWSLTSQRQFAANLTDPELCTKVPDPCIPQPSACMPQWNLIMSLLISRWDQVNWYEWTLFHIQVCRSVQHTYPGWFLVSQVHCNVQRVKSSICSNNWRRGID